MIELTDRQVQALEQLGETRPRFLNPRTNETFVLVPVDEYKRLKDDEYDDSPWTREELQSLAWNAGKQAGWEQMDEYDSTIDKLLESSAEFQALVRKSKSSARTPFPTGSSTRS